MDFSCVQQVLQSDLTVVVSSRSDDVALQLLKQVGNDTRQRGVEQELEHERQENAHLRQRVNVLEQQLVIDEAQIKILEKDLDFVKRRKLD